MIRKAVSKLHAANKTAADATALEAEVKKRISFEPFYAKTDHFTKTGSGQTQGKSTQTTGGGAFSACRNCLSHGDV